jgi:hypothetical protein
MKLDAAHPLATATPYYARVSALSTGFLYGANGSVGAYSVPVTAAPAPLAPAVQLPWAPYAVVVSPSPVEAGSLFRNAEDQLEVNVSDPTVDGAGFRSRDGTARASSDIRWWRIEYDASPTFDSGLGAGPLGVYDEPNFYRGSDGFDPAGDGTRDCSGVGGCLLHLGAELQSITLSSLAGSFTSGGFRLSLGPNSTSCIPVNATAAQVTALCCAAFQNPGGSGDPISVVRRVRTDLSSGSRATLFLFFDGPAMKGNVPQASVSNTGCTPYGGGPTSTGFSVSATTLYQGGQLRPGVSYYVRARAINSRGASPIATLMAGGFPVTPSGLPSDGGAGSAVFAVRDDPAALLVTWQRPLTDSGSSITGYLVRYSYSNVNGSTIVCADGTQASCPIVTAPATYAHTLRGLTAGRPYDVRVLSMNARGISSGTVPVIPPRCESDLEGCTPLSAPRRLPA